MHEKCSLHRPRVSGCAPRHEKFLWLFTTFHSSKSIHIPEKLCGELRKYKGILLLNLHVCSTVDPCVHKGKASLVCIHSPSNQPLTQPYQFTCRAVLKLHILFLLLKVLMNMNIFLKCTLTRKSFWWNALNTYTSKT